MKKDLLVKIIEGSIMIALTVALDFISKEIPILKMPSGGSVSFKLVPILVYSLRRGPFYGILSGVIYGFIAFLIDGYAFEPFSFFLDYILAFGSIGLCGIFSKLGKKHWLFIIIGCIIGNLGRFIFSMISGMFYYEGLPFFEALSADFIYNAPYIWLSCLVCTIIVLLLKKVIYYNINDI